MRYLESACKNLALLGTTLQKGVLQNDGAALDINHLMNTIGEAFDIVHNALYYWRKDCLITNHHIVDTMHECHQHNLVEVMQVRNGSTKQLMSWRTRGSGSVNSERPHSARNLELTYNLRVDLASHAWWKAPLHVFLMPLAFFWSPSIFNIVIHMGKRTIWPKSAPPRSLEGWAIDLQ